MSLLDSLGAGLDAMNSLQLAIAMLAAIAYSVLLNGSFESRTRTIAAAVALAGAIAFSAMTPSWTSGVVLMALAVVGFALFAAVAWLLSRLLAPAAAPQPSPASITPEERMRVARAATASLHHQTATNSL